ncbi:far upstream element-binding protein 1-like, partial [Pollicipes pollicipes]|uniref:far upstream element-binding protein 1-like n=1 Tax=Pollicipes pollicipes TaxID=41117 RepID=UPI001884DF63
MGSNPTDPGVPPPPPKGGETIKQLQDNSGSKMVVVQDGIYASAPEKPLRITGDLKQIERAKQLVFDLMAEKDNYGPGLTGARGRLFVSCDNVGGGGRGPRRARLADAGVARRQVTVPQAAVGVVIGKGGEMIKKVQNDTGRQHSVPAIEHAKVIIQELIESVMKRDQMGAGATTSTTRACGASSRTTPGKQDGGWNSYYAQYYGGQGGQAPGGPGPGPGPGPQPQAAPGNAPGMNPGGGQDFSAQWAEYYRNMGMIREAEAIEQQSKANKAAAGGGGAQPAAAQPAAAQPAANGAQADYSAQWLEYYRSQGLMAEAEKLEQQMKSSKQQQQQQPQSQAPTPASG